jgi:hypothetical protein
MALPSRRRVAGQGVAEAGVCLPERAESQMIDPGFVSVAALDQGREICFQLLPHRDGRFLLARECTIPFRAIVGEAGISQIRTGSGSLRFRSRWKA